MPPSRLMHRRFGARPVVAAALLVVMIAFLALLQSARGAIGGAGDERGRHVLRARDTASPADADCHNVHHAADQCAFVLANCEDEEAGLFHYLSFYYCTLGGTKPVAFAILALWLALLFSTIGIAASDFFSVNLSTIASVLGLSESLAGVTFLAFGNGSPDVFSTFAAMASNSGSMAVGELIGAAGFITAVVAGSMALVREFRVKRRPFVRDIVFFIVAVSFTVVFLADGELHLWECFTMIGFYLFYVAVVVGWYWFIARKRHQRRRNTAARNHHLYDSFARGSEELEPYRDEPGEDEDEDETAPVGRRLAADALEPADIGMLERAAGPEVDPASPTEEDEERREMHVAAEMASSMRVNRPRWGRSNSTITPIRPSLVGVLEFRSVLSSLQKERNMHLTPLPARSHSAQPAAADLQDSRGRPQNKAMPAQPPARIERALSYGNEPLNLDTSGLVRPESSSVPHRRASSASRTVDGLLAPPVDPAVPAGQDASSPTKQPQQPSTIRIPSPSGSGRSSPSPSPFPGLSESPAALTPAHQEMGAFSLPAPADPGCQPFPDIEDQEEQPKPVRWWPYSLLPAPHVFLATIFPTLQGWKQKTLWDKAVSLASVPSVFLLVTTLPVVETENPNDDADDDFPDCVADPPAPGHPGNVAPTLVVQDGAAEIRPETEWQEYRRRAHSVSSKSPTSPSPSFLALDHGSQPAVSLTVPPAPGPAPRPASSSEPTSPDKPAAGAWNRWLVAVQLFTGPLFVVLVLWANTADDRAEPRRALVRMVLYSLLVSLCLLAGLLATTTASEKPRYHFLLCFLGFVISVAWISTIAGEVVGVLKAFGIILNISEAILGLTVFAVGNSLGDLVADVTMARLGYPVMALSACFGGPMLNILLGVGIGGAWIGIANAERGQAKHPGADEPRYKPYRIEVGRTLMISAVTLLLTLLVLLIAVPSNRWVMSRRIGWGLIGIWTVGTVVNLVVEMSGTLADVSGGLSLPL
ncbi:hypothetical protein VTH06DRAFT_456 [Thermothelomyces fergusii]